MAACYYWAIGNTAAAVVVVVIVVVTVVVAVALVVVVMLTLTHMIKSVVTGRAPVTLECGSIDYPKDTKTNLTKAVHTRTNSIPGT